MLLQHRFDLRRENVEARRLDHALKPVGEIEEAVIVHAAEIAGMQPDAAIGMDA